jgi:hypothetical protein
MAAARKGTHHTEETKLKMSTAHKGKILTEEHKRKISEAKKGKTCTEETKAKISAATSGEKNHKYNGEKKVVAARGRSKRKRDLGYTLLMPLKEGEVGHHVTNEHVIGIPKRAHEKLVNRRQKHRTLILQWLKTHDKKKYYLVSSFTPYPNN